LQGRMTCPARVLGGNGYLRWSLPNRIRQPAQRTLDKQKQTNAILPRQEGWACFAVPFLARADLPTAFVCCLSMGGG